uniref:Uncharacterized protein n=1 Tax=wastewater metagenome TaxID=527639 RepID=A0A0A8KXZ3_9ZZZZ
MPEDRLICLVQGHVSVGLYTMMRALYNADTIFCGDQICPEYARFVEKAHWPEIKYLMPRIKLEERGFPT